MRRKNRMRTVARKFFLFLQEAPCASLSLANKNLVPPVAPRNSCTFREFVPILKEVISQDGTTRSYVTTEPKEIQKLVKLDAKQAFWDNVPCSSLNMGNSHPSHEELVQGEKTDKLSLPEYIGALSTNDMQAPQNYPRNVPVHVVDGNLEMSTQNISSDMSYQESVLHQMGRVHGQPNLVAYQPAFATTEHHNSVSISSIHQSFPPFHPLFTPTCSNQDDYRSFVDTSSAFSSLIVSALLQNPAAHAAASFAATFWPCANVEASADSSTVTLGDFRSRQMNSVPSMAAMAAATVAAATAWWAAHGLLPFSAPFNTAFTCTPASATATPTPTPTDNGQARAANNRRKENTPDPALQDQQLDLEYSEALQEQHSAFKLPTLSSDSEENENRKLNTGLISADPEQAAAVTELHDSSKTESRKQVDRSSCGSNTPSSSEVETDALEKHEKGKEESKEPDASHPASDPSNRRVRISSNPNDSWKEVSQGGRLAFQALFSRGVLPQSFSPPHDLHKGHQKNIVEKDKRNADEKGEDTSRFDLYSKTWGTCSSHQPLENSTFLRKEGRNNGEEGLLTMGLGCVKLKAHRMGFKPYKRCSVEAKESSVGSIGNQDEEKGSKRMRLEGGASA